MNTLNLSPLPLSTAKTKADDPVIVGDTAWLGMVRYQVVGCSTSPDNNLIQLTLRRADGQPE